MGIKNKVTKKMFLIVKEYFMIVKLWNLKKGKILEVIKLWKCDLNSKNLSRLIIIEEIIIFILDNIRFG